MIMGSSPIILKSPSQICFLQEVNNFNRDLLRILYDKIDVGLRTIELNSTVLEFCSKHNLLPAFKNYQGFPFCLCISINDEVIHGFPSDRVIMDGDVVSVDCGLVKHGYYSDAAFTKIVGSVNDNVKCLVKSTEQALYIGINKAVPGNRLYDIGRSISGVASTYGFNVVKEFVGHGVGFDLHESPKIPNYVGFGTNILVREGMVVAIEPMLVEKNDKVFIDGNGWTVKTLDGGYSAHFEQSIYVGKNGPEILGKL